MIHTNNRGIKQGFALPTVMIASVVMLMVLLSGLVSASSVNTSVKQQLDNRVLDQTLDSGIIMAKECLTRNGNNVSWTNSKPLKPYTNCFGDESTTCVANDTRDVCYVMNEPTSKFRTTFSVGVLYDGGGLPKSLSLTGTMYKLSGSTGAISKTLTSTRMFSLNKSMVLALTHGLSLGDRHACAITTASTTYCWGNNGAYGALGNNATGTSATPVAVSTAGVLSGVSTNSVGVGQYHSCVIAVGGNAYCWGQNTYGQLGNGNTGTNSLVPVAVTMPSGVKFIHITGGQHHTCALGTDYKAYCWGYNNAGQIGNGNTGTNYNVPTLVTMPGGVSFKMVTTKVFGTCALGTDNKAYCWGEANTIGTVAGTPSNVPIQISQGAIPATVTLRSLTTGGSYHVCGIGTDDKIYCWGSNSNGQLGNGSTGGRSVAVATDMSLLPAGTIIKNMETGYNHTCAISTTGKAYCWGENTYGQIGNAGTATSVLTPTAVNQGTVLFDTVGAGTYNSCALARDNKAYCWGRNDFSQVGVSNGGANVLSPIAVNTALSWKQSTPNIENLVFF